ncbi:MAG: DNA-binding response regulator [Synechococcaceae bacterium WB9_4xB_025]|nr:DNA-binding response regulator [Synechococcaceae bacterium WB9_4xB_025]
MLSTTTADSPIQVLLVDDDPRLRTLLQDELEDEGYQVSTAADAAGAWDQLNHCSPPDLLVLDWN